MKKTLWLALTLSVVTYGARWAWRAHQDLVTLEVRNADLNQVVRELRWQTWEPIYVGEGVSGQVTLKVKDQPLETVLDILNEQVNGRWSAVYPLYSSRKSLNTARALAQGQLQSPTPGWTNWNSRPGAGGPRPSAPAGVEASGSGPVMVSTTGRPPGGGPDSFGARPSRVSLSVTNLPPVQFAATFRRQAGVRVIPEDGTALPITLAVAEAPVEDVVALAAKKTFRKWTRFYVFESRGAGPLNRPTDVAATSENAPTRPAAPTEEQREQMRQQMAADPERQEKAMNRMLSGLVNSTPQQRAERDQMRLARQKSQARR